MKLAPVNLTPVKLFSKTTLLLCTFVVLTTLIITAPATLLSGWATQASQGRLLLTNVSGTLWQGSATPVLLQKNNALLPLQKMHWSIHPWSLFTGKLSLSLWRDDLPQTSAMRAVLSPSQLELHDLNLTMPAAVLGEISPMLRPAQLQGKIQLTSKHLQLTPQNIIGTAQADWFDAGAALSPVNPLGFYNVTLNGAPDNGTAERLNITLATTSGALILNGQGSWSHAKGLQFRGTAQAAEQHRAMLAGLLGHLGPQESPGVYTLVLSQ